MPLDLLDLLHVEWLVDRSESPRLARIELAAGHGRAARARAASARGTLRRRSSLPASTRCRAPGGRSGQPSPSLLPRLEAQWANDPLEARGQRSLDALNRTGTRRDWPVLLPLLRGMRIQREQARADRFFVDGKLPVSAQPGAATRPSRTRLRSRALAPGAALDRSRSWRAPPLPGFVRLAYSFDPELRLAIDGEPTQAVARLPRRRRPALPGRNAHHPAGSSSRARATLAARDQRRRRVRPRYALGLEPTLRARPLRRHRTRRDRRLQPASPASAAPLLRLRRQRPDLPGRLDARADAHALRLRLRGHDRALRLHGGPRAGRLPGRSARGSPPASAARVRGDRDRCRTDRDRHAADSSRAGSRLRLAGRAARRGGACPDPWPLPVRPGGAADPLRADGHDAAPAQPCGGLGRGRGRARRGLALRGEHPGGGVRVRRRRIPADSRSGSDGDQHAGGGNQPAGRAQRVRPGAERAEACRSRGGRASRTAGSRARP